MNGRLESLIEDFQLCNAALGYDKDPVCSSVYILLSIPADPVLSIDWSKLSMWGHAQDAINRGSQGIQEQSRLCSSHLQRRRDLDLLVRGSTETRETSAKRWDSVYHVSLQIILFSSYSKLEMMRASKEN